MLKVACNAIRVYKTDTNGLLWWSPSQVLYHHLLLQDMCVKILLCHVFDNMAHLVIKLLFFTSFRRGQYKLQQQTGSRFSLLET